MDAGFQVAAMCLIPMTFLFILALVTDGATLIMNRAPQIVKFILGGIALVFFIIFAGALLIALNADLIAYFFR
jgi:hypothetical protein